ncbi:MAG: aminotransferase class V-fold PLP-dependent enzyme [Myxococcota bacterium]
MLDPESLRPHYHAFLDPSRVLLTGHSHQAWPDVAKAGVIAAFEDAALRVDDKWERAFGKAAVLRSAIARIIGAKEDEVALGQNTHELVARFLSALPLRERPRLITTSGEFNSMVRQLRRLSEEGIEIEWVEARPVATLADRLVAAVDERASAVLCSTVLFETAEIVPDLPRVTAAAHSVGAAVLFDAYHAFGVVPQRLSELGPDPIYYTAGGYKYAQWGEGCCFLRVPSGTHHRPVYTGWFADFATLGEGQAKVVGYGAAGQDRFAGSTYDPTSHYRAAEVVRFFERTGMTVPLLRELSLQQTGRIIERLGDETILTPRDETRGGFVAVRVPEARELVARLRNEGVFVDARGDILRFGPAPYLTDDELDRGVDAFRRLRR